jgi:hypothetical protein
MCLTLCGEELLSPRQTPNLEDRPSSVVRDSLFNKFAATIQGRSCSMYGGEERCKQGFGGETWRNETTWTTQA